MKRQFPHTRDADDFGVPPLSRLERIAAGATVLGGAGVGGFGFYASFDSVSQAAASWGFTDPWVLPVAIDSAIPVFTAAHLLLIRTNMSLWWARLVPWVLSLVTCALNVASGDSLWSKVAHAVMALLWVGVSEIAAHTYAVRIGAATGRRRQMDKVRWARWFLAPLPTFLLWRRMKLWELRSYEQVLQLEQERLVYQAQLRGEFGRAWRRKAPVAALLPLQLVAAGVPLAETAAAGLRAAGIEPSGIFAEPVELPAPPAPAPAIAPAPAPSVPAAVVKPRPVTATVTPPPQPQAQPQVQPQPQGQMAIPGWSTEDELFDIIKDALDGGHREVFNGPLTGAEIARVLGFESDGNGRKVRGRLIKTYAAQRNIDLPPRATVDQVFAAFGHAMTPVGP